MPIKYNLKIYLMLACGFLTGCSLKSNKQHEDTTIAHYSGNILVTNNYLLIPVQNGSKELSFDFTKSNKLLLHIASVRLATGKPDYYVPVEVTRYKGQTIRLTTSRIDKKSIAYLDSIKQSDRFSFNYNETYRPDYHFSPHQGWTNDPNGMVYFNGVYHLFYQHNPYGSVWGNMHWGHAVSKDLMTWKHMPDALVPDSLGSIFSGSAVIDKDNTAGFGKNAIVAIYTAAGKRQTECIAYSLDQGATFKKYKNNPVISDLSKPDFRDPNVFWYQPAKKWIMSLATGQTISFYASLNLKDWEKTGEFRTGTGAHGGVWECPNLFPLPYKGKTKWVLLVSINPGGPNGGSATQYFIGDFDGKCFKADRLAYPMWVDYGHDNYAGVTWNNVPHGRRIFIGWMSNWLYANQLPEVNFKNAFSIPRELKLVENGSQPLLCSEPVKEIANKISDKQITTDFYIKLFTKISPINNGSLSSYNLSFEVVPHDADKFAIVFANRKGEKIFYNFDLIKKQFTFDRSMSGETSFSKDFSKNAIAPLLGNMYRIKFDFYIDKSSFECFINGGKVVSTNLVFPTEPYYSIKFTAPKGTLDVNKLGTADI